MDTIITPPFRNENGWIVITGLLNFKSLEEAYLCITHGYSEPDEIRATGETYDKLIALWKDMYVQYVKRCPDGIRPVKYIFNNAKIINVINIPEGEIHFIVTGDKKRGYPHLESILKVSNPF